MESCGKVKKEVLKRVPSGAPTKAPVEGTDAMRVRNRGFGLMVRWIIGRSPTSGG
jgi:hypothetical protein